MNRDTLELVKRGGTGNKGDVLGTAQIGGIMGAKKTSELIPMCHPVFLSGVDISLSVNEDDCAVEITAAAQCIGQTGVEMEALTAVSVAALTVYDMCKAAQKNMVIDNIHLLKKSGGKSGDYESSDNNNKR
jgi:cyclic pyranopterin phosphate synthase